MSCLQYIENLDKLKKLQQLNLSSNMIERIEKLDKCLKLKDLNLSYNLITKIEGLENLMYLQVLNLTGNKIEHIPVWLAKRLRALRTLHLGKNNLQSVSKQDLFSLSIKHLVTSFFFFLNKHSFELTAIQLENHMLPKYFKKIISDKRFASLCT